MNGPTAALLLALVVPLGVRCGRRPPPRLPPLVLRPVAPELERLAAAEPKPPSDARRAELEEEALAAFLPESDPDLARRARRRLLEAPEARAVLEGLLVHSRSEVRAQAAYALGEIGDPLAVPPLLWRLRWEADASVRIWMAQALARLGTDWGLSVLADAIDDARFAQTAYEAALPILERAGVELPEKPSWADVKRAIRRVHRSFLRTGRPLGGDPIALDPPLEGRLARLLLGLLEFQLRPVDEARWVLARMGRTPLPLLEITLHASEPYLRVHSVEIARDLGPPARRLTPHLLPLLADEESLLLALEALGAMRAEEAGPAIAELLRTGDPDTRTAAAEALGPAGGKRYVDLLAARLDDEKEWPDVRVRAAFSLAWIERGGRGLDYLRERLRAGDYHEPTLRELLARLREEGIGGDRPFRGDSTRGGRVPK